MAKGTEVIRAVHALNMAAGTPTTYFDPEGKINVGHYTVDYNPTYGGYVLEQVCNTSGGVRRPLGGARYPKRVAIAMINALCFGIEVGRAA